MPDLSTKTARRKLKPRHDPYWTRIGRGRSLGYRTVNGGEPGQWKVRLFVRGSTSSGYKFGTLGTADDLPKQEADGQEVLDYSTALSKAGSWDPWDAPEPDVDDAAEEDEETEARYAAGTVGELMLRYMRWYEKRRKSVERVRYVIEAHVLPELGDVPIDRLTVKRLEAWHVKLSEKPAHVRTPKKGKKKKTRVAKTKDEKRARKVTANRALTVVKAALHRRWERGGGKKATPTLGPWSEVAPFEDVERARVRYLNQAEAKRLVNACEDPDFRRLVVAAIYTGCRYSELAGLKVADVMSESSSVYVQPGKTGESRHVYLSDEAMAWFEGVAAGRPGGETLLLRDGKPWKKNHQQRPMAAACEAAKIEPRAVFHELRHTFASQYLQAGGGLPDLAKQLGHASTAMVQRHYGHLADDWRKEQARKYSPTLGIETNVEPLKAKTA